MKPRAAPLQSSRLLDQVRERIRYMHYSLATEKVYLYWVRFFVRWSGRGGQMRHPRGIDVKGVEAFLTMLAAERHVSASTHNQVLSAILFLYREVLAIDLPWPSGINRPTRKPRIPAVLTQDEVAGILAQMEDGITAVLARLLYSTGMRLMEAMRLRFKDVDFARKVIIAREANGGKDRVVMLPGALAPRLHRQLLAARALWEADRHSQRGGVERRHHLYEDRVQRPLKKAVVIAGIAKPVWVHTLRHYSVPFTAIGHRHPRRAGAARPFGCQHHDDLRPRAQGGCRRSHQSAGRVAGRGSFVTVAYQKSRRSCQ